MRVRIDSMQKRTWIICGFLITISIVILLLNTLTPFKFLSGFIQTIFVFPKSLIYSVKTGEDTDSVELEKIRGENKKLTKNLIEYEKIKRDNEALRSQFESGTEAQYKLLPARVIGFAGRFSKPNSLIIDKGTRDNVKQKMGVMIDDDLVGVIGKVSNNYSEIILATGKNFSSLGRTAEGNILGVTKGQDDFILFDQADVNGKITTGELILTKGEISSEGFGIPGDLVMGRVSSVNKNESLPYQTAKVESRLAFSKLETVFIILGL